MVGKYWTPIQKDCGGYAPSGTCGHKFLTDSAGVAHECRGDWPVAPAVRDWLRTYAELDWPVLDDGQGGLGGKLGD
jgi:hypothetical protein